MRIKVRLHPTKDFDLIALKSTEGFPFQSFFRMAVVEYILEGRIGFLPLPETTSPAQENTPREVILVLPDQEKIQIFFSGLPNGQRGNVAKNIFRVCLCGLFLPGVSRSTTYIPATKPTEYVSAATAEKTPLGSGPRPKQKQKPKEKQEPTNPKIEPAPKPSSGRLKESNFDDSVDLF